MRRGSATRIAGTSAALAIAVSCAWMVGGTRPAVAAQLGPLNVASNYGEPLRALVELIELEPDVRPISAALAASETYAEFGVSLPRSLEGAGVTLIALQDGRWGVRVVSLRPVDEPDFNLVLAMTTSNSRQLRRYRIVADPPMAVTPLDPALSALSSTAAPSAISSATPVDQAAPSDPKSPGRSLRPAAVVADARTAQDSPGTPSPDPVAASTAPTAPTASPPPLASPAPRSSASTSSPRVSASPPPVRPARDRSTRAATLPKRQARSTEDASLEALAYEARFGKVLSRLRDLNSNVGTLQGQIDVIDLRIVAMRAELAALRRAEAAAERRPPGQPSGRWSLR